MSKSVRLNDAELSHIFEAARPIPVDSRDAFLEQVATLLRGCSDAGPGDVHRAIEQAQRQFFIPPQLEQTRATSRWDRDRPNFARVSKQAAAG